MKIDINNSNIKDGAQFSEDKQFIIYKKNDDIKICLNKCKHQGNQFSLTTNPHIVKCPAHSWELDLEKMQYIKPHGINLCQEILKPEIYDEAILVEERGYTKKKYSIKPKQLINNKELTITHYTHATAEINCGKIKIITDPWCEGPAFTTGWWLNQKPPNDWLQKILSSNLIYISHSHSDHLNIHTLKRIKNFNSKIKIIIPAFKNTSCDNILKRIGFTNVYRVPFLNWQKINKDCRYMLLEDFTGNNDSGMLIEYKGYTVLNMVDSHNLNNGDLPKVDVLMGSFSGGSSGHPVCWENYNKNKMVNILSRKKKSTLNKIIRMVDITKPRIFVPFAGYFSELHPADEEILTINTKNKPEQVEDLIKRNFKAAVLWIPTPGQILDISTLTIQNKPYKSDIDYNFENYDKPYYDNPYYDYMSSLESIQEYFNWADYKDDKLILHIIETDQSFKNKIREFYVNFKSGKVSEKYDINEKNHYLRMKVKSHIFRYILSYGFGWEEISIGFQARFYRNPDIYNRGFWNHFQHQLPQVPLFKELYNI